MRLQGLPEPDETLRGGRGCVPTVPGTRSPPSLTLFGRTELLTGSDARPIHEVTTVDKLTVSQPLTPIRRKGPFFYAKPPEVE